MTGSLSLHPTARPTNRFLVGLKDRLTQKDGLDFLKDSGFTHLETFEFPEDSFPGFGGDLILVEAQSEVQSEQAIKELASNSEVDYAEPDAEFELGVAAETREPNDLKSSLWGLDNSRDTDIDAPEAWAKTTGSNDVLVAVIDTGVDYNHPDLVGNIWTNPGEIAGNGIDDDNNGFTGRRRSGDFDRGFR